MNDVHFDVSNVRGFAEQLHYRLQNEYKPEIARMKAKLLGSEDAGPETLAATTKPMGNIDAEYYGRDIAETQTENVTAAIVWLDNLELSLLALVNAALYTAEELDNSDGNNAANIDKYFEAPTYEEMDYLDPSNDPTR